MSFLHPYILIALVLPLLLAGLFIGLRYKAGKAWRKLVSPAHVDELVNRYPAWKTILSATLALLALTFSILGLARPINGYSETGGVVSGRNLIIALDVSRSMLTQDVSPSRLSQAKSAATELINALPSDKIGLIIFSGDADLVVPLTYDHAALLETIEQVDLTWMEYGGTNLSLVLDRALQDFKRSAPEGTNALVILSDGEDTEDTALQAVSQKAQQRNLRVIAVGVGTMTGDVIPDPQGENGLWKDARGKHVISKLQPKNLSKLAELTGGDFMVMGSGTDLAEFARLATAKIDRHEEETSVNKVPNDLFTYFAAAALFFLLAAIIISTDWRMPRRAGAVLLAALAVAGAPYAGAAEKAPAADDSVEEVLDTDGRDLLSPAQHYANGQRFLQAKKTDRAKEEFSRALLSDDPALQSASLLALGNISSNAAFDKLKGFYEPKEGDEDTASATTEDLEAVIKDLESCITLYQDALAADPTRSEARTNLQRLQGLIQSLRREIKRQQDQQENEQEQQDKESQGQQDNNKDKRQQNQQQQPKNQQNQQGKQNQQNQQQQGQQQGRQQQNKDRQQGQKQTPQDSQQQQNQQQDGQKDDQQDSQQQEQDQQQQQQDQSKSERQDKLEDLNDSLQDEIDRLKQKRQEPRSAQDQLKDAKDLAKDLQDELDRLKQRNQDQSQQKEDKQQDQQKEDKQQDQQQDQQQQDGKKEKQQDARQQQGKPDSPDNGKTKKDLDKAMDLTRQLEQELRRMQEEAEDEQSLTPEEQEELEKSRELIRNLREQIRLLKEDEKRQEQEEAKQGKPEEQAPALSPEKERELAEERADNILKMSLDEEKGSPIPHFQQDRRQGTDRKRRPLKDY